MNTVDAVLPLLEAIPYFAGLQAAVLTTVASNCRSKAIPAGQIVFTEGDPCRELRILQTGQVKFYRVSAEGREQVMRVFDRPGDTFCIASAFSQGRHIVSARAATQTRLHLLDMETVNRLVREHPSVGLKLMAAAGQHMAHLVELIDDLALKSATARLAKYLYELTLAESAGKGGEIRLSRDRLRQEELASMLGTVRVHVSRILVDLARAGAIDVDRKSVRIRDPEILLRISKGG